MKNVVLFAFVLVFLAVRAADNHLFVALWDAVNEQGLFLNAPIKKVLILPNTSHPKISHL